MLWHSSLTPSNAINNLLLQVIQLSQQPFLFPSSKRVVSVISFCMQCSQNILKSTHLGRDNAIGLSLIQRNFSGGRTAFNGNTKYFAFVTVIHSLGPWACEG